MAVLRVLVMPMAAQVITAQAPVAVRTQDVQRVNTFLPTALRPRTINVRTVASINIRAPARILAIAVPV